MQYVAVFVTQYNYHYQNFRILSQVVAEKSLTEKNVHMYFIGVTEGKIEKRRQNED